MRYLSLFVILIIFMSGCGWSDLPPVSSVTISALPAKSPIAPSQTVVVTGTITGYSGDKQTSWSVQESYDAEQKMCRFYTGKAGSASFTECKYGYVVYDDTASPMQATYYAPPTLGTYHITFGVLLIGNSGFTDTRFQSGTTAIEVK
jgi:hypothetical protein